MMPDYEVKVWTYEMAQKIGYAYIDEALERKKWAFAADVVRLYALYEYGGIYMDSDVFLKHSVEPLLTDEFVTTMEYHQCFIDDKTIDSHGKRLIESGEPIPGIGIQAAFLASVPKHYFVEKLLSYYKGLHFIKEDGTMAMSVIAPAHYAMTAESYGFAYLDVEQKLDRMTIHPSKYIAGGYAENNKYALAVHCCNHSWYDYSMFEKIKAKVVKALYMLHLK